MIIVKRRCRSSFIPLQIFPAFSFSGLLLLPTNFDSIRSTIHFFLLLITPGNVIHLHPLIASQSNIYLAGRQFSVLIACRHGVEANTVVAHDTFAAIVWGVVEAYIVNLSHSKVVRDQSTILFLVFAGNAIR